MQHSSVMQVLKRDGRLEDVQFDKITRRLVMLAQRRPRIVAVDVPRVAQHACAAIHDLIKTETLDHITADAAVALATEHPDYSVLAARILVSNLHKTTRTGVADVYAAIRNLVSPECYETFQGHADELDSMLDFDRDFQFDYFGFKTLQKAYLLPGERPQHMYLRVAVGIWGSDLERVKETYDALSTHKFTHASPTLFNAGTKTPQLASCFLLGMHVDSLDSIFETFHKAATISKFGGGIGLHVHTIRAKGSLIKSTNGTSDGLVPMLKVANEVFKYVNQCFVPETIVYAIEGPKRMDDIRAGDHIMTRDGTFKRVNDVFARDVSGEPMVRFLPHHGFEDIVCTPVHDILMLACQDDENPRFRPASELQIGDYVGFPIPAYERDDPSILESDCFAYGKAVTNDLHAAIDPKYLHLPRAKVLVLLHGMLTNRCADTATGVVFNTPSRDVVLALRYMCLRLGVLTRAKAPAQTRQPSQCYQVTIPKHPIIAALLGVSPAPSMQYFQRDGILWTRLLDVQTSTYTGTVYDFNMQENHNYTTDGGVVHNSGKRKGSCAIYIEPHHADIFQVLDLKRNQGDEHLRARDLFYALWISDLFMERVEANAEWSLFDPGTAPGLEDVYGDEYRVLYERYEAEGRAIKTVAAQDLWFAMLRSQIETGVPYMVYKDAANRKSNQQNLGTIKSSNLCVAPETLVLTRYNKILPFSWHRRIDQLCDTEVDVWNGKEWSTVVVKQTSERTELLRVTVKCSAGFMYSLDCTPYHKMYVNGGVEKRAHEVQPGDTVVTWFGVEPSSRTWWTPWRARRRGAGVATVVSVEHTGRMDATYCFDEPKRHMGVFNGILTGNCSEIIEYTAEDEIAVCNLGSLSLPAFVTPEGTYDYASLHVAVKILTRNLDRVIDVTYYPVEEARRSNMRHRPIGLGVQGLADVFFKLKLAFDSPEAAEINRKIFATLYHAAVEASCDIADIAGPYDTFEGSPASRGELQFDLWNAVPDPMYDWDALKRRVRAGMRNSLLVAPMPTASTAQILGNTEAFEPITSNLYSRTTLAGTFTIVNKYLLNDLIQLGVWSPALKQQLVAAEGSVQSLDIPDHMKRVYKTAYELSMKTLIDMAADRGVYVDQSMSLNLFVGEPTFRKLSSMHFYAWRKGLKTGMYYLRSKPASGATKITVETLAGNECIACSG